MFVLQGNPFCLQSDYLQLVQTSLHTLQYFDGNKVSWPTTTAAAQPTDAALGNAAAIDNATASKAETDPSHGHPQLQLVLSQLSVPNTVPGRLPTPDAASEPSPPLYYYYLQLCTADGGSLCSFPLVLTPQDELAQWQVAQAAEPVTANKKAVKKAPAAGKGSKADGDAAPQRNAWYPEVNVVA